MPELTPERLRFVLLAVITMIFSSAVHEWAHAFTAVKLGDETPRRQGRLTLNPVAHIDPIGTILMPAFGAFVGFLFGYAKPVQFVPHNLTRKLSMRTGIAVVAIVGPISNLILAFVCAGLMKLIPAVTAPDIYNSSEIAHMAGALLYTGIWLNVVLFLFNFLPVYPLDGSKIMEAIVPRRYDHILEVMRQNAMLLMLFVFFIGVRFLTGPVVAVVVFLHDLFDLGAEVLPFARYLYG